MAPHQQRVADEKAELDEKLRALGTFFGKPTYRGLPSAEQDRLLLQYSIMTSYSHVLRMRIEAF